MHSMVKCEVLSHAGAFIVVVRSVRRLLHYLYAGEYTSVTMSHLDVPDSN